jgi:hypothetical protein
VLAVSLTPTTFSSRELRLVAWFAVLFLVSQLPLYIVRYPDIGDYPNHLARLYVLQHLDDSAVLRRFYVAQPGVEPNLALDFLGRSFVSALGPERGLKAFLSLCTLILTTGTIALNIALTRRLTALALGSVLFAQSVLIHFGLFNFVLGTGVALWLAALWINARIKGVGVALALTSFAPLAVVVYLCHLSALGIFLLTVFAYEYSQPLDETRFARLGGAALIAACLALPSALVHLVTYRPTTLFAFMYPPVPLWAIAIYKVELLPKTLSVVYHGDTTLRFLLGAIAALGIYFGWRRGKISFSRPGLTIAAALAVAIAVLPPYGFGTSLVDARLLLPLLLVAGASLGLTTSSAPNALILAIALGVIVETADTTRRWLDSETQYTALREAMHGIRAGSRVAAVRLDGEDFDPSPQAAAWAVIDRSVFLSSLYARPFQPVSLGYRPELVELAKLARPDYERAPLPLKAFRGKFDYIVAFGREPELCRYAAGATLLYKSSRAILVELPARG